MTNDISKNDRRGEFYWVDGKPYLSVTKILDCLDKPALRYWYGSQVYNAMIAEPNLDRNAALARPYEIASKASDRGSTVHSMIESYKATGKHVAGVVEPFATFYKGFVKWVGDNVVEIMEAEKTVISKLRKYAGTLDAIVKFQKSGKIYLVDVKTNEKGNFYPEVQLQLSAYWEALESKVDGIAVLVLDGQGNYNFKEFTPDIETFMAAKRLYEWLHPEIMEVIKKYQ